MTLKGRCDACRKAKIKCDEARPICSNCTRRGKECTHSGPKKAFKFVDVTGEVVDETDPSGGNAQKARAKARKASFRTESTATAPSGPRRKIAQITTQRRRETAIARRETGEEDLVNLVRHDLFHRPSDTSSLVARWLSMMPSTSVAARGTVEDEPMDGYGAWTVYVLPFIGKSQAINDAARCFMDCKLAFANPSDANLRAVRASNMAAVNSIRLALLEGGKRSCSGMILLSIQLLYVVEALMLHTPNALIIHVKGLLSLLKQHREQTIGDPQETLISRLIFSGNVATGSIAAVIERRDHELDDPLWLNTSIPSPKIRGVSAATVRSVGSALIYSWIRIPRLIRLVREAVELPEDNAEILREAIEVARVLLEDKRDSSMFKEALASGQIQHELTVLPQMVDELPTSYRFGSTKLTICLVAYWAARSLICGLVQSLLELSPDAVHVFDVAAVRREDVRTATDLLMAAQQSLIGPPAEDPAKLRAERLRLILALRDSYSAWGRLEARARTSPANAELELTGGASRARRLRLLTMNLTFQIVQQSGLPPAAGLDMKQPPLGNLPTYLVYS